MLHKQSQASPPSVWCWCCLHKGSSTSERQQPLPATIIPVSTVVTIITAAMCMYSHHHSTPNSCMRACMLSYLPQALVTILNGLLVNVTTSLMSSHASNHVLSTPSTRAATTDRDSSSSSAGEKPPSAYVGTTQQSNDVYSSAPSNLALLHAFLRSENTLDAVGSLHTYASRVWVFLQQDEERVRYREQYASEWETYNAYITAVRLNQKLVSDVKGGRQITKVPCPVSPLLAKLPHGIAKVPIDCIPFISKSPPGLQEPPNSPLLQYIASSLPSIVPYTQFLLDLHESLSGEMEDVDTTVSSQKDARSGRKLDHWGRRDMHARCVCCVSQA